MQLASVQFRVSIVVPGLGMGAVAELNAAQVALEADCVTRVVHVGDELVVPFESVVSMRRARSTGADAGAPILQPKRCIEKGQATPLAKAGEA
jgi:hypothetical protein